MRSALIVACNAFNDSDFTPLRHSLNDAAAIEAMLRDETLCGFDEVNVLLDAPYATAQRALEKMARTASLGDMIFFYYSGHGKLDWDGSLALVMRDTDPESISATSVGSNQLKQFFNLSRAGQKVIVLDCCYSGAFGEDRMKGDAEGPVASLANQTAGTFVLTASTKFQPAFESETLGGSALTSALVEGVRLGKAGHRDTPTITVSEMAAYARDSVASRGGQQPQYWSVGVTGEVIFSKRPPSYDAVWRGKIGRMLNGHVANGNIEDHIVEDLRSRLKPGGQLDPAMPPLLESLRRKDIGIGVFVSRWTELVRGKVDATSREIEAIEARANLEAAGRLKAESQAHKAEAQAKAALEGQKKAEAELAKAIAAKADAEARANADRSSRIEAEKALLTEKQARLKAAAYAKIELEKVEARANAEASARAAAVADSLKAKDTAKRETAARELAEAYQIKTQQMLDEMSKHPASGSVEKKPFLTNTSKAFLALGVLTIIIVSTIIYINRQEPRYDPILTNPSASMAETAADSSAMTVAESAADSSTAATYPSDGAAKK